MLPEIQPEEGTRIESVKIMTENGMCYDLTLQLQPVVEQILQGYCFCRLIKPFLEKKERAWCTGAVYFLTMMILYAMNCHPDSSTAVSAGIFVALIVMCWLDRRNYEQKIFLSMTLYSMCWLASAIAEIFNDILYDFAAHTDYMQRHDAKVWGALYVVISVFYILVKISVMLAGIRCILKVYVYKSVNMTKKELCMLSAPLVMGIGGFETIHYYRSFYILETGSNINAYDVRAVVYYTVSIAVIVVVIGLYQSIRANQEEKLQNELLSSQIDSIRHHIGQVEMLYQNIRGIRHDMANHILTLERLYAGNRTDEAKEYSLNLKAALSGAAGEIRSGNPVTDVILQEWKSEAEKKEIQFRSDFYFPAGSDINAFDISVILNNALQNAVENVEKCETPYISIRSYHKNNAYMTEISNSFTGSLQWDYESSLPVTSKKEKDRHGYGLASIRRVAEKYSGDIAIDIKDGEFLLSVMLMMEK